MSKKICQKCGSVRIVKANEDVSICLACESLLNTIDGKSKQTVFDHLAQSPETLAEKLVVEYLHGVKDYAYYSTVTRGLYNTKAEAIAATVEKLREVYNE